MIICNNFHQALIYFLILLDSSFLPAFPWRGEIPSHLKVKHPASIFAEVTVSYSAPTALEFRFLLSVSFSFPPASAPTSPGFRCDSLNH